jgi:hypothetical protein
MSAGRRSAARRSNRMRHLNRRPLKSDMRYPQTFPPSVSPTPRQCNRTIPYQVRRYPAARNLIRGRPSVSVRQQTGNRNEWPLSGRLTLPGNGEDGRKPDPRICTPFYAIALPPVEGTLHTPRIARRSVLRGTREHGHRRASEPVTKGSTEQQHGGENRRPNYAVAPVAPSLPLDCSKRS